MLKSSIYKKKEIHKPVKGKRHCDKCMYYEGCEDRWLPVELSVSCNEGNNYFELAMNLDWDDLDDGEVEEEKTWHWKKVSHFSTDEQLKQLDNDRRSWEIN